MAGYDYVVVGGGAAGCVMAARLTEDPDVSVLLLEAGPADDAAEIEMPLAFAGLFHSRYDWDFYTEPEPLLNNRPIALPRGRVLGGSTSINGMVYTRGSREDFDNWAALGAEGWGYDDVLPYFKKSEDNERGASEYHGAGGELSVSDARSHHAFSDIFLEACEQAGHPASDDFNGARQEGVGYYQVFHRDGRRCSNAKAFLHPVMDRPNLTVRTETHALRILFDGAKATGVESVHHGQVEQHRAGREVILCAGAIQSPQLLLCSGVGPAAELAAVGIQAIADLPVGQGFQDHQGWLVSWRTEQESLITAFTPENIELWQTEGRGPLSSNLSEAGGFLRSSDDEELADFQLYCLPALYGGGSTDPEHGVTIAGYPTKSRIRGAVRVRNGDTMAKPSIVHNYLSHPDDMRSLRDCLRRALEISDQPAFQALVTEQHIGPASRSDEDLDDFIRRYVTPTFHQAGSCAIGSVVDNELRVIGFEGLRVIDASVMPDVNRGNTTAPTTMIAEKGADMVRGINSVAGEAAAAAS